MLNQYQKCIEACQECASVCHTCAVCCLQEDDVQHLTKCIQLDLECAAICTAAAQVMSLNGELAEDLCQLCIEACDRCARECGQHSELEHCRNCADACHECAEVCSHMSVHA